MPTVELDNSEWGQILNMLGDVAWKISNPLLMKIGQQLQAQALQQTPDPRSNVNAAGNGQEVDHAER